MSVVGNMTEIAVVIVNHNTCEHLRACLATIRSEAPSEMVVVDNASSDGSVEMVQAEFPQVVLRANETNPGYGAAANQGIANCTAPYVLLLNSDTLVQPGALAALSTYLELHPDAAIIGPRLVNPDGRLQASCYPFPTPVNLFLEESTLGRLVRHVPVLRSRYLRTWSHGCPRAVPWVLGAALMIRRDAFDAVGAFDESFFMYLEEVDLSYRLWSAGWEVHFAPVATITHVGGASTAQYRAEMAVQFFASLRRFYRRHYSGIDLVAFHTVVTAIVLVRLIRDAVRLRRTHEAHQRARIAESLVAWQRVLLAQWRGRATAGGPLGSGTEVVGRLSYERKAVRGRDGHVAGG